MVAVGGRLGEKLVQICTMLIDIEVGLVAVAAFYGRDVCEAVFEKLVKNTPGLEEGGRELVEPLRSFCNADKLKSIVDDWLEKLGVEVGGGDQP